MCHDHDILYSVYDEDKSDVYHTFLGQCDKEEEKEEGSRNCVEEEKKTL